MTTTKPRRHLGDLLIEAGKITPEQLEQALAEQRRVGRSIGRVLVEAGLITEQELVATLARQVGIDFVDLAEYQIDPLAVAPLPEAAARPHTALPIAVDGDRLDRPGEPRGDGRGRPRPQAPQHGALARHSR